MNNSPSIDSFYQRINKKILLAAAYTEIAELPFIIKSCRLKPYSYVFEDRQKKTVLYDWWFDEFGNSLKITDKKKIEIIYNDLALDTNKITCTDLYSRLEISKILKISKLAYIVAGKDEDINQDFYMIHLLGIDMYWRSYLFMYGEWQQISPLMMTFDILNFIAKKHELKYFLEVDKKSVPVPCFTSKQWLTSLPISEDLYKILKKDYDGLSIFTKGLIDE